MQQLKNNIFQNLLNELVCLGFNSCLENTSTIKEENIVG